MNRHTILLIIPFIMLALTTSVAVGADALTRAEAEKLIKGNTAEGHHTKWNREMIWYFHESGQLRKLKDGRVKGKAEWSLDKKGQLCFQDKHMDEDKCEPIIPGADGGYDANDGKWRWEKVVQGNPHNL